MAQADEPITEEVVREEMQSALEAMAEDGDSELGVFKIRFNKKWPSKMVLVLGKDQYLLEIKRL